MKERSEERSSEKNCKDCFYCTIKLLSKRTPRDLAEGTYELFNDSRVMSVGCSLGFWEGDKEFSSMRAFEASELPKIAAQNCGFYASEQEEE